MVIIYSYGVIIFGGGAICLKESKKWLMMSQIIKENDICTHTKKVYTCFGVLRVFVRVAGQSFYFKLIDNLFSLWEMHVINTSI